MFCGPIIPITGSFPVELSLLSCYIRVLVWEAAARSLLCLRVSVVARRILHDAALLPWYKFDSMVTAQSVCVCVFVWLIWLVVCAARVAMGIQFEIKSRAATISVYIRDSDLYSPLYDFRRVLGLA